MKKPLIWLLTAAVLAGMVSGCVQKEMPDITTVPSATEAPEAKEYTYRGYTDTLPARLDPFSYSSDADATVLEYLQTPLVSLAPGDASSDFRWCFEAAESITDVTRSNRQDLSRYGVSLPVGKTEGGITSGFVFEIRLRQELVWENGDPINADTYLYSMQKLLDPYDQKTSAPMWYSGAAAVAGGEGYYYSAMPGQYIPYVLFGYRNVEEAVVAQGTVYLDLWSFWGMEDAVDSQGQPCPQWVSIADTHVYIDPVDGKEVTAAGIYESYAALFEPSGADRDYIRVYLENPDYGKTFDSVGFYKVDDHTLRYVTREETSLQEFLTACTESFLVHPGLYDACAEKDSYGTDRESILSYGPYKLERWDSSGVALIRNEAWYDWQTDAQGELVSFANVTGAPLAQYATTRIELACIGDNAVAEMAFFTGALDQWSPHSQSLGTVWGSDRLYRMDSTYALSLFFNTDLSALLKLNETGKNKNAQILFSTTFRKAMSLAVDRAGFAEATPGYQPAYTLLGDPYIHKLGNDGTAEVFRESQAAMEAMCRLYEVSWGKGGAYATLEEAYASITGSDLQQAKALMAQACAELQVSRIYTTGDPIHLQIAWSSGPLTQTDRQQVKKLEEYLNAAMADSGFGPLTLEAVGELENRYAAVPSGAFAIGWGAWGSSALHPFRSFLGYCDSQKYPICEAACWDPYNEPLTMVMNGKSATITWCNWSRALFGDGYFAGSHLSWKVRALAGMEEEYLKLYYRIPLCTMAQYTVLGHKLEFCTDRFSPIYGYGGLRYASYRYTDSGWEKFVAENGGYVQYTKD